MKKLLVVQFIVAVLAVFAVRLLDFPVAQAHTGSPSPTTWTAGQTLTYTALNDTIAHIHNTLSGGIANVHLSSTAAIGHTKLATPALVPKAWAAVGLGGACNGGAAAGTACTMDASSQMTSVTSNGTNGQYRLNLAYTPVNANFAVLVSIGTNGVICRATSLATATPHALIECLNLSATATNAIFHVMVLDDNS